MIPARANFTVYQGADFSDCIYLKNTDGTPFAFAYTHGRLQLREYYGAPIVLELLTGGEGLTLTSSTGQIQMDIDATVTEVWVTSDEPQLYLYDLVCWDDATNPSVDRVAEGYFVIRPEISRVHS